MQTLRRDRSVRNDIGDLVLKKVDLILERGKVYGIAGNNGSKDGSYEVYLRFSAAYFRYDPGIWKKDRLWTEISRNRLV